MEEQRTYEQGSLSGPAIIFRRPVVRPPGAEAFIRIALCALSAMFVSLAWILGGPARVETKVWSVLIGLSAVAAMSLFAGLTRSENDRLRAEFAESEVRTLAAIELLIQSRPTGSPPFAMDAGIPPGLRMHLARIGSARADPGEILTDEFRFFLQGRESRDEELRGGPD